MSDSRDVTVAARACTRCDYQFFAAFAKVSTSLFGLSERAKCKNNEDK